MSVSSPIIEKVQKLLALSKSSNANEAAAAAAVANRLIDQYRLSQIDLETDTSAEMDPVEEDSDFVYESGKVTAWKQTLVSVLARHYGCAYWINCTYDTGRKVSHFKLVGKRSDIGITRYMFSWLMLECQRLADLEAKGCGRVFIASYCMGFVNGVAQQLQASRVEAQKEASSAAIVKIDARAAASKEAMYKLHTNLRPSRSISQAQVNGTAFAMGQQKGSNIHLGARIASGGPRLLGK